MTVDDILERQRMATQVSNDDEKKTPVQTGNGGAATSGVTPAATPANETQKGISQADARVNYSTRELVPAQQNIVPQGTSQESARVNYTTPVWERDDSITWLKQLHQLLKQIMMVIHIVLLYGELKPIVKVRWHVLWIISTSNIPKTTKHPKRERNVFVVSA